MVRYSPLVSGARETNNTAITPGTHQHINSLDTKMIRIIYPSVRITRTEYFTSTRTATSLPMLSNIVGQSVMKPTRTEDVNRRFVETKRNGFQTKLTPSFLILTTVKVPVKIPPEVAMPAQTKRNISTAPSQEFVFTETFSVMVTSTVRMEKMKIMSPAFQPTLSIKSSENTQH